MKHCQFFVGVAFSSVFGEADFDGDSSAMLQIGLDEEKTMLMQSTMLMQRTKSIQMAVVDDSGAVSPHEFPEVSAQDAAPVKQSLLQNPGDIKGLLVNSLRDMYGADYIQDSFNDFAHHIGRVDDVPSAFPGSVDFDSNGDGIISRAEWENNFEYFLDDMVGSIENGGQLGVNSTNSVRMLPEFKDADIQEDVPESGEVAQSDDSEFVRLLNLTDEEFEQELLQMSQQSVQAAEKTQQLTGAATSRSRKRTKQKKWMIKMVMDSQVEQCGRHNFPVTLNPKEPWESCPDDLNDIVFFCSGCHGAEETPTGCWEGCGDAWNLPELPVSCWVGAGYCVKTDEQCVQKVMEVVTSWGNVLASVFPNAQAMKTAVRAAKQAKKTAGALAGAKVLLRKVIRASVKKLKKKAKKNLRKYMRQERKELKQEVMDDIMDGGLESMGTYALRGNDDVGELAEEIISAVDPTGIYDAVKMMDGGNRCRDIMLEDMPTDDMTADDYTPLCSDRTSETQCMLSGFDGFWGDWYDMAVCEPGSHVVGFRQKVEPNTGGDDTAMNAVQFKCSDGNTAKSKEGVWGDWSPWVECPYGEVASGFDITLEWDQRDGDDTTMNGMQLKCEGGSWIAANNDAPWGGGYGHVPVDCPSHMVFAGFQPRLEYHSTGDDTGLNAVSMVCSCKHTVEVVKTAMEWGQENSWTLGDLCGGTDFEDHSVSGKECCVIPGQSYVLTCIDSFGDGWHGGYIEMNGHKYCEDFTSGKQQSHHVILR